MEYCCAHGYINVMTPFRYCVFNAQGSMLCQSIFNSFLIFLQLFDVDTLEVVKVFPTERPVNSAAISPIKDHVILGGGQEAMEVTTTTTKAGKFEARCGG